MYALGVDLGTTWTAAATYRDGLAQSIPLGDRAHAIPSVVLVEDDGTLLVGEAAALRAATAPQRVAAEFKRRFGDDVGFLLAGHEVTARELVTALLAGVLRVVTDREGEAPEQLVVTAPATWRDYRVRLLAEAAADAGVSPDRLTILPEPAAAAVHYASRRPLRPGTTIGIYDLGGGTFDASLLRKTESGFEILGQAAGTEAVGGLDVDDAVVRRVAACLEPAWTALDRSDPQVRAGLAMLRASAVQAKESLSSSRSAIIPVVLPDLVAEVSITRDQLEQDVEPLVQATIEVFRGAVADAGLTIAELDAVLLVGGASRMPIVQRMMAADIGIPITIDEHPKYAVCLGAAISAGSRLPGPATAPPVPEPVPLPPPPEPDSARVTVDLAASGLWDAAAPLQPAVTATPQRVVSPEPLVMRIGPDSGYRRAGLRAAATVVAVITAISVLTAALIYLFPK